MVLITDYNLPAYTGNTANTLSLNALNGVTLTTASVANYFDPGNTPFGTAQQLATLSSTAGGNPSSNATVPASFADPFSETTIYTFVFAGGRLGDQVSGNAQIRDMPEPASIAIVGAGLVVFGLLRRRSGSWSDNAGS